jgi:hypothetical protein
MIENSTAGLILRAPSSSLPSSLLALLLLKPKSSARSWTSASQKFEEM